MSGRFASSVRPCGAGLWIDRDQEAIHKDLVQKAEDTSIDRQLCKRVVDDCTTCIGVGNVVRQERRIGIVVRLNYPRSTWVISSHFTHVDPIPVACYLAGVEDLNEYFCIRVRPAGREGDRIADPTQDETPVTRIKI